LVKISNLFCLNLSFCKSYLALIYDTSLDMVEYRLSYLRLAKQNIIYQAQLPRISLSNVLRRTARTIIYDLTKLDIDLILCIMSTEREIQFVRLIRELGSSSITQLLLNRTSWWFTSRLDETYELSYFPKIFTASEDRRRMVTQFASTGVKILLNAILKTYIRLSNTSTLTTSFIGPATCDIRLNVFQLRKTHMFIKYVGIYIDNMILFFSERLIRGLCALFNLRQFSRD
jgi:hypothetical protein